MKSLEQIRMMNADPELKGFVEAYGWNGGQRVQELWNALFSITSLLEELSGHGGVLEGCEGVEGEIEAANKALWPERKS